MRYEPQDPPQNGNDLPAYVYDELQRIAAALGSPEFEIVNFTTLNAEPDKPREGDTTRADGTNWNPGSGEGIYTRLAGGTWSKL